MNFAVYRKGRGVLYGHLKPQRVDIFDSWKEAFDFIKNHKNTDFFANYDLWIQGE